MEQASKVTEMDIAEAKALVAKVSPLLSALLDSDAI